MISDEESEASFTGGHENPDEVAQELFARLLHPHDVKTFFKKTWLKKPLHIRRKNVSYYEEDQWFSTDELDRILVEVLGNICRNDIPTSVYVCICICM